MVFFWQFQTLSSKRPKNDQQLVAIDFPKVLFGGGGGGGGGGLVGFFWPAYLI
jgi:hypothetical protein